jgi:hypothetical protein
MYCPECGNDAGDAKFCPECGADLAGVKKALSGKPAAAEPTGETQVPVQEPAGAEGGPRRLSPAVVWGAFAALAVVVILVVVMVSGGFGGGDGDSTTAAASDGTAQVVEADTSGSYEELVQRADGLYDQGAELFQTDLEQGVAHFTAAAKVYAAAWAKQATEPSVGTDFAVSLFYSGDIEGALQQVDAVLKESPDFQKGWLNKGIFLSHEARIQGESDPEQAEKLIQQAKTALTKAVAIDPESEAGKQADESLQALSSMQ